jgi:hypothetical protein
MNSSTHIKLLADMLGSHGLESRITARLADHAQATIRIWPYAVSQNRAKTNEPPPGASEPGRSESSRDHQRTHVLVLPSTIDVYDQARRIVFENPVLALGETRIRVMVEPLPLAEITALFLASRVEYCLALGLVLDDA